MLSSKRKGLVLKEERMCPITSYALRLALVVFILNGSGKN
jgi:hypothetical protein